MFKSKLIKYIIYAIFLISVMELSARLVSYYTGNGFSTSNYRFISPFFTGTSTPIPFFTDSSGIFANSEEILLSKNHDIRIMCIGGSTTENKRNILNLRYSDVLNDTLNTLYPNKNISVINVGISAYSSAHSLINFSLRLIEFKPDIIIVMHNVNDRTANNIGDIVYPDYANKYLSDSYLDYHHRVGIGAWFLKNFKSFRILKWSSKTIKKLLENTNYTYKVNNQADGKRYFKRNMKSIISIAKANDIIPVIMTQPKRDLILLKDHHDYNEIIIELASEEKIGMVDLSSKMSNITNYFVDEYHYSIEGIYCIANTILPQIYKIINSKLFY